MLFQRTDDGQTLTNSNVRKREVTVSKLVTDRVVEKTTSCNEGVCTDGELVSETHPHASHSNTDFSFTLPQRVSALRDFFIPISQFYTLTY